METGWSGWYEGREDYLVMKLLRFYMYVHIHIYIVVCPYGYSTGS